MKILIINSSPRKNGNSKEIANIIENKFSQFGDSAVEVEQIFLTEFDLHLCRGCCNCLTIGEDFCPLSGDDRKILEEKLLASNGVIFVSPVYAMNMPAILKNFMDRFAFTMHRPRFFEQYTMLIAVTGAFGTKETINSLSQIKYSGFNIIEKLHLKAQSPLENINFKNKQQIKKIEDKIEKFYSNVRKKTLYSPSLMSLISFRLQQKSFSLLNPKKYADWKYFNENGWFNETAQYYTQNAKIPILKEMSARAIANILFKI